MNKIKCIIVEDEVPAAQELKYIISRYDSIYVSNIAYDGETGMDLIKTELPNVVFLDINMPVKNGMELARAVKEYNKEIDIVFVTAYEKHAVQAFEVGAMDYILKPFDDMRISKTIDKIVDKWQKISEQSELPKMIDTLINEIDKEKNMVKRIPCDRNGKIILVDVRNIYYCYIENEKTYVRTKSNKYFVGYTLHQIEERTNFFRAHRSYLVNMDNIRELYSWFNGTYKLVMNDSEKSEIPISRNNVKRLKQILKI
ncbi:DNA-binding response regulator [Clostridium fermenticellae]|uniref:Stage 0 sporulation protein A homolog n=1 Tax=Clostridium fermenticellae TaxID=2068654 RepID=A0A386H1A1_9CLOT|nr:LytTR family DNA-binding domain-containing protein [Clostridium fermenticellae]AYD39472.1 DNA-binding response regulator [Clostridium fermenticellae]